MRDKDKKVECKGENTRKLEIEGEGQKGRV